MTFPETVKTTFWDIIDEMSLSISSFVNNPDKDFLRRRKLDFQKMMRLIISMESGSMNHELLKFFNYDSSVPTSSAFYQQRSKLSVSAFHHLLREFNIKFPLEKFRNKYYLIACDGSEFNIARNLKIQILTMNKMVNLHLVLTWFIPSPYMRYALNVILIWKFSPDVEKMNFRPSAILWIGMPMEDTLFSLLTEDFPVTMSLLMQSENQIDFMIRAKDLNVQRLLGVNSLLDKLDTTVELILTRTQSKKKHKHPE